MFKIKLVGKTPLYLHTVVVNTLDEEIEFYDFNKIYREYKILRVSDGYKYGLLISEEDITRRLQNGTFTLVVSK